MRRSLVLGMAFVLLACGDDGTTDTSSTSSTSGATTSNGTTTSASSSSGTGGMGGNGGSFPSVGFDGQVVEDGKTAGLADADVCIYAHPEVPCVKTDAMGKFSLPIPDDDDTGVQVSKTGYGGVLVAVHTNGTDWNDVIVPVPTLASITSFYAATSTPYPNAGKGFLSVHFTDGPTGLSGGKTTLVPAGGDGPFYADVAGTAPDGSLMATSTSGTVRYGALIPGTIEVDATCMGAFAQGNYFGWPTGGNLAKLAVPIVDGFETRLGFTCQ